MEITHNNLPEAIGILLMEVQELRTEVQNIRQDTGEKKEYHGIAGIAEVLNCCSTTAQRVKNTGLVDGALITIGRQILVNKPKLQELYKQNEPKIKSLIKKSLNNDKPRKPRK